jgi:hypothetical protein
LISAVDPSGCRTCTTRTATVLWPTDATNDPVSLGISAGSTDEMGQEPLEKFYKPEIPPPSPTR